MTVRNDTGNTREDKFLAHVYQQTIGAQAEQYAAAYDASVGLKRFTDWLQDHAAAELDADQAVAQLYSRHYQPLIRLAALLVRDAATAEEVVQDAFVAMHGAWPRLGDAENALAYLRQAVVNRSRSVLRHRSVVGTPLSEAQPDTPSNEHEALDLPELPGTTLLEAQPDTPSAEREALDLLELPAARAALRGLPERQREAIVLRYCADLSEDQIAAAMRISRGAVKSHTARGLSALRAALERATSPPARPEDIGHGPSNP
jgi:RNA polymerase sigma factor (sigma-70 family)